VRVIVAEGVSSALAEGVPDARVETLGEPDAVTLAVPIDAVALPDAEGRAERVAETVAD
jgi:hypothetical protein